MQPLVHCLRLTKRFGKRTVLASLDLAIERFEKLAVLGISGSGKTTLLRILAGLEEPTTGDILLDGRPLRSFPSNDRRIGMVFQRASVYPHLTVRENLAFPLQARRRTKRETLTRVEELAEILKLVPLLEQRAGLLSGGEAQRVAIGKAIAVPPQLLLLDEPFSNLHQALRWQLIDELRDLHAKAKLTTIFVTHEPAEAFYLADRVAILSSGNMVQIEAPRELASAPASLAVAQLIYDPAPAIIDGCLRKLQNGLEVAFESNDISFSFRASGDLPNAHQVVKLLLRPQDARVIRPTTVPDCTEIRLAEGYVSDLTFYDTYTLASISCGRTTLRARIHPEIERSGDSCIVYASRAKLLFFDSETQGRLDINPL